MLRSGMSLRKPPPSPPTGCVQVHPSVSCARTLQLPRATLAQKTLDDTCTTRGGGGGSLPLVFCYRYRVYLCYRRVSTVATLHAIALFRLPRLTHKDSWLGCAGADTPQSLGVQRHSSPLGYRHDFCSVPGLSEDFCGPGQSHVLFLVIAFDM